MIYKMLFGISPFLHKNRNLLLQMIQYKDPIFPDPVRHKINYSSQVKDLILRLLSKNRTQRLGS